MGELWRRSAVRDVCETEEKLCILAMSMLWVSYGSWWLVAGCVGVVEGRMPLGQAILTGR